MVSGTRDDGMAPTDEDLRARLDALEAENARLRETLATRTAPPGAVVGTGPAPPQATARTSHRGRGRAAGVVALVVVATLLTPVAAVTSWARSLVTDTDRYLATVAPIADDPVVQQAVTNRTTTAIVEGLDVEGLAGDLTTAVAGLGLPPRVAGLVESLQEPLVGAVTGRVRSTVGQVVASDGFSAVWATAHRTVHEQLVAVLRGDEDAIADLDADGTLSVQLGPVVEQVQERLVDRGFTVAARLPAVNPTFPLASSPDLVQLQSGYRLLDVLGTWLPWLVIALLVAAVLLARRRARALMTVGLAFAGGMLLLGIGLAIGRQAYLGALPDAVQRPDAAAAVYDHVVALLRVSVRAGLALGLVVAVAAYLGGGSASARATRAALARGGAWLRDAGERRGVTTGPVGAWLGQQRRLARIVILAGAAVALVAPAYLSGGYVLGVAIVALVLLVVVEVVARPPSPA
ncbi:hypothetical protein [Cellulomonas sp. S1-8]|uniref:hypothetical protein n=1 Tax=Cellulomonas sp. S1-8 TaxID=2904790 RepID=UPI002244EC27|nr:hypothetical protein [Cellulomonas sp. S1-8]UZN01709.1 hypothetical protein OKX07_11400 [Cellulomonas sp. S1-8]